MPVALITGASAGFGLAVARALATRGWSLIIDARGLEGLDRATEELRSLTEVTAVAGDVADPAHRTALIDTLSRLGHLDLLINNASHLGPSPQPRLAEYPLDELRRVYEVDVVAPIALIQGALTLLVQARGMIVNVTSDAACEAYEGWGGYGSAKAALDQVSAVLATEHPSLAVYAFDPGDMRTAMHQAAFPGEDISDRPEPAAVVPAFLQLVDSRPPSGRHRSADLSPAPVEP